MPFGNNCICNRQNCTCFARAITLPIARAIIPKSHSIQTVQIRTKLTMLMPFHLHPFLLFSDALVKKLLPLGFTRYAIRRELRLSDGNLDTAALNLLEQQEEREREEEEAGGLPEGCAGGGEEGEGKKKSFTIGNIEVFMVLYFFDLNSV